MADDRARLHELELATRRNELRLDGLDKWRTDVNAKLRDLAEQPTATVVAAAPIDPAELAGAVAEHLSEQHAERHLVKELRLTASQKVGGFVMGALFVADLLRGVGVW